MTCRGMAVTKTGDIEQEAAEETEIDSCVFSVSSVASCSKPFDPNPRDAPTSLSLEILREYAQDDHCFGH